MGERDPLVLELNREAMQELGGEASLATIPCASHLFEEPGALEEVARLARDWFVVIVRPAASLSCWRCQSASRWRSATPSWP